MSDIGMKEKTKVVFHHPDPATALLFDFCFTDLMIIRETCQKPYARMKPRQSLQALRAAPRDKNKLACVRRFL